MFIISLATHAGQARAGRGEPQRAHSADSGGGCQVHGRAVLQPRGGARSRVQQGAHWCVVRIYPRFPRLIGAS
eukprot:110384-Pyramimonas_sp.AAC.1